LPRLTAEDLRELGVASVGHRRRLLDAIAALGAPAPAADASGAETSVTLAPKGNAERRQLTVMFCDLVGSTALSARFDPEDLRGIIGAYHRCVTEIVEGFGGFVARYGRTGAHSPSCSCAVSKVTKAVAQRLLACGAIFYMSLTQYSVTSR
jgi:class 3 adenylate cyclase